jgi:hypothetical protein
MKRIIQGKVYNTETATLIAEWDNSPERYPTDFHYEEVKVYKTKSGACFTVSKYNPYPWEMKLLHGPEILELAQKIGEVDFVAKHFPALIVEG